MIGTMGTLARYLRRMIFKYFLLVLVGLAAFILSIDLAINSKEIIESRAGEFSALVDYSLLRLPEIASLLLPASVLIATLLSFASLIRHHELIAIWNGQVSPIKACLAVLPLGILLAVAQFTVDSQLVPKSLAELNAWGIGEYGKSVTKAPKDAYWLRSGNDIVRLAKPEGNEVHGGAITIFKRNPEGELLARIDAEAVVPDGEDWKLIKAVETKVAGPEVLVHDSLSWRTELPLDNLAAMTAHPSELTFLQLFSFVVGDSFGLHPPQLYKVWLHQRLAGAITPILLMILAVLLAQRFERGGNIGLLLLRGFAFGFGYFALLNICHALGQASLLPAIVSAWVPPLILTMIAANFALHHETPGSSYFQPITGNSATARPQEQMLGVVSEETRLKD